MTYTLYKLGLEKKKNNKQRTKSNRKRNDRKEMWQTLNKERAKETAPPSHTTSRVRQRTKGNNKQAEE